MVTADSTATAKLSSDPNINAGDWPPNLVKNLYLLTPNESEMGMLLEVGQTHLFRQPKESFLGSEQSQKTLVDLSKKEFGHVTPLQILFHSYIWDQRPVHAYGSINTDIQEVRSSSIPKFGLNPISYVEKFAEMNVSPKSTKVMFSSRDSALVENNPDINMMNQGDVNGARLALDPRNKYKIQLVSTNAVV
ncbi:hypothetical protein V6N11_060577 [Hibiscus sabdariffa]|uniref:Uncharacterized protein n=1 Tax=Hibiscus sabdariffa TaxID=183260 RepID=A0ABR2QQQ8_9ROSI